VVEMIGAILDLVTVLFSAVPEFSYELPMAGGWTLTVPAWTPVAVIAQTALVAVAWNLALILLAAASWVYRHIPQLWGFGPGSG